jgi:multidrug efflux pump subunit AcrB
MNPAKICLEKRTSTWVLTVCLLVGGLIGYQNMSRLEDPEFTIKDALVITPYPGATANEVEMEVTDEIEMAAQKLAQVDKIESRSERGLSTVTVTIKDSFDKETLPQVWDELRRKVNDAQSDLPPGAMESIVIDDYGDVYGVFFVVYGSDYSYAELKRVVDLLKRELLLVDDVSKIDTLGEQQEVLYVELNRDRLSLLGVHPLEIVEELDERNLVSNGGRVQVGTEYITLRPTGAYTTVEQFNQLLISASNGKQFYLRDVGQVRRGYEEPISEAIRYNGNKAIALGISTISGGNVITMGEALETRMLELKSEIPLGIEFGMVSVQSEAVSKAIGSFIESLVQAVLIVIAVLLVFMGVRSGLLIGVILVLTIIGSFMILEPMGVALERISLGALIIALGMLVDNAIVVVDGILIGLQRGKSAVKAAIDVVGQSLVPLLGATVIAILAFAAIGTSQDSTGEFCRSLFQVIMVSLFLSWVIAVTVTPLFCVLFLKESANSADAAKDPYGSAFYRRYKALLVGCIKFRWVSVGAVLALFLVSLFAFTQVKQSFFPPSTRPQFMVDFWMPQGTHPDHTMAEVARFEEMLLDYEPVEGVSTLIGRGALRFLLTYSPERSNESYVQFLVDVNDNTVIDDLILQIEQDMKENFPNTLGYGFKFEVGPGSNGKIEAKFSGPEKEVLRRLSEEAVAIMKAEPNTKAIKTDWRERVKVIRPVMIEQQANLMGVTYDDVATIVQYAFEGLRTGTYREGDLQLPIIFRAPESERFGTNELNNLQIWSDTAGRSIPLMQVVSGFETSYEDPIIIRKDRKRTLSVFSDPIAGPATELFASIRPKIEALELPEGYSLSWGGEFENTANAQGALASGIPPFLLIMIVVTILLFNNLRQPLVVWSIVPLAVIGVSFGLLTTGQPFGFMALLGFLSLSGMLIKNAIVLIDEINFQLSEGLAPLDAIVDSAVSRLRPVAMAALTTALGMIPLFFDAFFVSMAVTIVFGLLFASVLTMIMVPVFYAIFYGIKS